MTRLRVLTVRFESVEIIGVRSPREKSSFWQASTILRPTIGRDGSLIDDPFVNALSITVLKVMVESVLVVARKSRGVP